MKIDPGMAVVVAAVLIFYLRLIVLQRERVRSLRKTQTAKGGASGKKKQKAKTGRQGAEALKQASQAPAGFSILSTKRRDLAIGAAGMLAIVLGLLLYSGVVRLPAIQPYWWAPTAAGIVGFSFAFRL